MVSTAQIETRKQAIAALGEYASHEAKLASLDAKRTAELRKVSEKYDAQIEEHEQHLTALSAQLQDFVSASKEQKIDLPNGVIGFKKQPPSVALTPNGVKQGGWDWVLIQVQKLLPDYIRTKHEIDKRMIIQCVDTEALDKKLEKCGMHVTQTEKFYIKVN